jgi:hypothetical protein
VSETEITLAVWLVGTLPATYVAARRSAAWQAEGLNEGPVAMTAIMFWPVWFVGALIIQPLLWPIKALYVRVWKRGEKDNLTAGSGEK